MDHLTAFMTRETAIFGYHVHIWLLIVVGAAVMAALGLLQHSH
ncbi:MAG TPA: hypothetical protein VFA57_20635 [Pseudolabrys sp.]|jgi:hypothetical protein|nr:hypothetical protein [Pseudolabrys sp.]